MFFITILAYYLSFTFLVLVYRKDEDFIENMNISINLATVLLILSIIIGGTFK